MEQYHLFKIIWSAPVWMSPLSDNLVSEYNESFIDRLYKMDLDWNDLLDTDPKHYEVTDEQINLLFD